MGSQWTEIANCKPSSLTNQKLEEYLQAAWIQTAGNMKYGDTYAALLAEKTSRQNKVTVRISLGLSILAVILALSSLLFSALDWHGDKEWQSLQIAELRAHSKYLKQMAQDAQQSPAGDVLKAAPEE